MATKKKEVTLESLDSDIKSVKKEVENISSRVDKLENPTETVKTVVIKCDTNDLPPRTKRVEVEYQHVPKTLEDYSIDEIAYISESGKAREYFKEGDVKRIKIGESWYDATIIAFDHYNDWRTGESFGITFQVDLKMRSINRDNTNRGGYPYSDIRENLEIMYNKDFPKDWKKHIKRTPIECYAVGLGQITIWDHLFIPSAYEVYGEHISSKEGMGWWSGSKEYLSKYGAIHEQEGTPIPYLYEHRRKGDWYWTRSAYLGGSPFFWYVDYGGYLAYIYASNSGGVALCWCI